MHRFLRWVERDLVCSAPFLQLGLTLLGFCQDGDDAGTVCELFEPIQIVRVDNFLKTGLVDGRSASSQKRFQRVGPSTVPWKTMFLKTIFSEN